MSAIIEKPFDASKKIIRSIFKGSPNLITSSDLNRQIEAIKYQLDQLDDKTGVISDIEISQNLSGGTLNVSYSFTYMKFKGCNFSPAVTALNTNLTVGAPTAYLCLVADSETITYESDSSHDIAGARFEDGTSLPAANQMVYTNESLILTHALSTVTNLVGVIAVFNLSDAGNVIVQNNFMPERDSLALNKGGSIVDFDSSLKGIIGNGKTYDEAFSILENRAMNLVPQWTELTKGRAVTSGNKIQFIIRNGCMFLNTSALQLSEGGPYSSFGSTIITVGEFPNSIHTTLLSLFKSFNLQDNKEYNDILSASSSTGFIPFGEFGSFPVAYVNESGEKATGVAKLCLLLEYYTNGELYKIEIGCYVSYTITYKSAGGINYLPGPVDFRTFPTTNNLIRIPRLFAAIPLPGVF